MSCVNRKDPPPINYPSFKTKHFFVLHCIYFFGVVWALFKCGSGFALAPSDFRLCCLASALLLVGV